MRRGKEIDFLLLTRAKARAAVLASYPTDTASGSPANFPDGADGVPVKSLVVNISVAQEGSGIPSEENVRPITIWPGATVYHSGADTSEAEEILVSWQDKDGNVCGGTLDVTTGVLTVNVVDVSAAALSTVATSVTAQDYVQARFNPYADFRGTEIAFSDRFSTSVPSGTTGRMSIVSNQAGKWIYFNVPKSVLSSYDTEGVLAWIAEAHPQFVVQTADGDERTYQLSPKTVQTLYGENNLWSDAGEVTVEYRADLDLYIEKRIGQGGEET